MQILHGTSQDCESTIRETLVSRIVNMTNYHGPLRWVTERVQDV